MSRVAKVARVLVGVCVSVLFVHSIEGIVERSTS